MPDDRYQLPPDGYPPTTPGQTPPQPPPIQDEIILNPQPRPLAPPPPKKTATKAPGPGDMKDGTREVVETIVFVVVLVLILKTFLAEAFVIPTGSMADTLLGYHREVSCDRCGYRFLVNFSNEVDPQRGDPEYVLRCYCANCRFLNDLRRKLPERPRE